MKGQRGHEQLFITSSSPSWKPFSFIRLNIWFDLIRFAQPFLVCLSPSAVRQSKHICVIASQKERMKIAKWISPNAFWIMGVNKMWYKRLLFMKCEIWITSSRSSARASIECLHSEELFERYARTTFSSVNWIEQARLLSWSTHEIGKACVRFSFGTIKMNRVGRRRQLLLVITTVNINKAYAVLHAFINFLSKIHTRWVVAVCLDELLVAGFENSILHFVALSVARLKAISLASPDRTRKNTERREKLCSREQRKAINLSAYYYRSPGGGI